MTFFITIETNDPENPDYILLTKRCGDIEHSVKCKAELIEKDIAGNLDISEKILNFIYEH